ncbi:hypothetical protein A2774_05740 [Candidatus Roizmanbacteria bacterium RIFCSPHIGHO2_01_FULL_39_12c]|uniref:Uncharacterized protein n=1 Tax=Candidatus Roizmanbacteria bacterium RIFCSPHIGHO2_01_FULL_39_12c TaxID=1802031 RepID=A0A1F7G8A4_9BACT|nr:MAG: hypothetical protein A2774_05740 [Candidatus Roizmanbacteria bacterium RIFCSPHIGHO2_01_FULL_39_12c]OGK47703.1 MAG: hypothetical protein A2963_00400 [Candidatus Roizmanbacteria bacterium RIFCSPLOWO2_01_FULL_40_13]
MVKIQISKNAEKKIKKWGLWDDYETHRDYFISDPGHPSLDYCPISVPKMKGKYPSFKIKRGIRALLFKHNKELYTVFDAGEFHKKQPRK